jgi:hypothetical protein
MEQAPEAAQARPGTGTRRAGLVVAIRLLVGGSNADRKARPGAKNKPGEGFSTAAGLREQTIMQKADSIVAPGYLTMIYPRPYPGQSKFTTPLSEVSVEARGT